MISKRLLLKVMDGCLQTSRWVISKIIYFSAAKETDQSETFIWKGLPMHQPARLDGWCKGEWLLRGTAALACVHTRLFGCDSSDYCTVDNAKREDSRMPSSLRKRKRRATMTLSLSRRQRKRKTKNCQSRLN